MTDVATMPDAEKRNTSQGDPSPWLRWLSSIAMDDTMDDAMNGAMDQGEAKAKSDRDAKESQESEEFQAAMTGCDGLEFELYLQTLKPKAEKKKKEMGKAITEKGNADKDKPPAEKGSEDKDKAPAEKGDEDKDKANAEKENEDKVKAPAKKGNEHKGRAPTKKGHGHEKRKLESVAVLVFPK